MFTLDLPLSDVTVLWPLLVLLGAVIGTLSGLFGLGAGFLIVPALRQLFGIPYPIASGSALLQIFCTCSFSAYKHYKLNNVDLRLGSIMAGGAMGGVLLGKAFKSWLAEETTSVMLVGVEYATLDLVMNALFIVLMSGMAIAIWRETSQSAKSGEEESAGKIAKRIAALNLPPLLSFPTSGIERMPLFAPLLISFFVGTMTGLLGVGGGFITLPLLVYIIGVPTRIGVGTNAFMVLFASGFGALVHYLDNKVELWLVGAMLLGSLLGVQLGIHLGAKIGSRGIRRYLVYILALGILLVLSDFKPVVDNFLAKP